MSHDSDPHNLRGRARRAFERTMADDQPLDDECLDPETLANLERALRSLRRLDCDIFLAVRLDAMSYTDIAARTGLSVAQVEHRMTRALRRIVRSEREELVRRRWWLPF